PAMVLGTEFKPGCSPTSSIAMVHSIASTHMRITPAESITASTINAAYALNRGDQVGSLEGGKLADFVIHDCEDYRELAYYFGIEHPWMVYLGGTLVYERKGSGRGPDREGGHISFDAMRRKHLF